MTTVQIGADFQLRITQRITELPTPREPRRVVEVVLSEMMPRGGGSRAEAEAAVAFAGRAARHPEIAGEFVVKGGILPAYVAGCIRDRRAVDREGQQVDAELAVVGLLAMTEGMLAQTLLGRHTPQSARAVLAAGLDLASASKPRPMPMLVERVSCVAGHWVDLEPVGRI